MAKYGGPAGNGSLPGTGTVPVVKIMPRRADPATPRSAGTLERSIPSQLNGALTAVIHCFDDAPLPENTSCRTPCPRPLPPEFPHCTGHD